MYIFGLKIYILGVFFWVKSIIIVQSAVKNGQQFFACTEALYHARTQNQVCIRALLFCHGTFYCPTADLRDQNHLNKCHLKPAVRMSNKNFANHER